jgi:two-component system, cell cycle sensor histidine kinase DivJ
VSFLTPVWSYIDALVHPVGQQDALTAARHRAFIAPRLLASLVALASFPVYIAIRGVPTPSEVGLFSWFMAPILIVYYLSRTGHCERAHVFSLLSLTGLVVSIALCAGGTSAFAAIWLVVVPLDAAFSASRRVVTLAGVLAFSVGALLLMLGQTGATPEQHGTLAGLIIITATLYSIGLALGAGLLMRTSFSLLHAEADRYRLLTNTMNDAIVRLGQHGSVLSISPAAELLIGVPVNELLGNGLFDRVHVVDRPIYLTALSDAARLNEERVLELRLRRGAQQFVWVEMHCRSGAGICGKQNHADCEIVAILSDISERKYRERAVEIAQSETEHVKAERSRFMATMGHELRTPLNAIIGFSELLTSEKLEPNSGRRFEYARLINDSGQHLLAVVDGILDVSKMDTGNFEISPELFAPAPVIEDCANLLALKAKEAGVELKLRLDQGLPEVTADRCAFNQIMINLISNAVKFTPSGGRVTVGARRDGPKLVMTIEDTGVGIGDVDLPRVGQAFFQARAARRHQDGSGLGLSIVKGLVHLHDGEFEIKSRLGEGTRVTVRLPFECQSSRRVSDPVELAGRQNRGVVTAAFERMKKSA